MVRFGNQYHNVEIRTNPDLEMACATAWWSVAFVVFGVFISADWSHGQSQLRGAKSPEVGADRKVTFRLQVPYTLIVGLALCPLGFPALTGLAIAVDATTVAPAAVLSAEVELN